MDSDSEQMFHDLEQRHVLLRKEHDVVCVEREAFKGKLLTLQNSVDELREKLAISQSETLSRDHDLKQFQRNAKTLEDSSEDIHDRYRRRSEECDRLRDDVKHQAEELTTVQSRLRDCQTALSDAEGLLLPVQYELSKCTREKDLLIAQAKELQSAQISKVSELLEFRRATAGRVSEQESELSNARTDAQEKQDRLRALQDRVSNQEEKINAQLRRIEELETAAASERGTFSQELEGLRRIGDLYKRHFEEAAEEVKRLEEAAAQAKEVGGRQIALLRDSLQALGKAAEEKRQGERGVLEAKVAELEGLLTAEQHSRSLLSAGDGPSSPHLEGVGLGSVVTEGFSAIEMYNRVAATERELSIEKGKRREADLYLNRILKDMERNAPLLLGQKRDLNRVLESHAHLTARLDEVGAENTKLREERKAALESVHTLQEDAAALTQHNSDLSRQIQHLLKRSMDGQGSGQGQRPQVALIEYGGESSSAQGVISEHLLTYDDISELQTRNSQLLKVVRKLSADQETSEAEKEREKSKRRASRGEAMTVWEGEGEGEGVESAAALQAAMKELGSLRETRERTEEMVLTLVQQRDLYKAMLEEADITLAAKGSPSLKSGVLGSPQGPNGPTQSLTSGPNRALAQELQKRLAESEEEKTRIKERAARLEEAEKMLHERLEKALGDNVTLRVGTAQSSSEARFQKERCERLESGLLELKLELATASQRRLDMERMLVQQQSEARAKDESLMFVNESLRVAQDAARRAEIEAEVTRAAEGRIAAQLADTREELRRQASLSESVRRIESGLSSRVEEEKLGLLQERDGLSKALEGFRKQVAERTIVEDQRLRALEDDLRAARMRADERTAEASSAREQLVREQGLSAAAQERAAVSERQLSIAQERLSAFLGNQVIDSVVAAEAAQRDVALERALAEVESLQSRLEEAERHTEQFRLIGSSTEMMLRELRDRSAMSKEAQELELSKLKSESEALRSELDSHHSTSMARERDIEKAREELQEAKREAADRVRALEEEALVAKLAAEQYGQQMEILKGDALKFQATARAAHGSYERELQLHAKAERDLKDMETEMDALKETLVAAQHTAADLTAASIRQERALHEERARVAQSEAETKEHMEGLRTTNDILHGQVQSLGVQVNRLLESRAAVSAEGTVPSSSSTATASSTGAEGDAASNADRVLRPVVPLDNEEVAELRRTSTELREVVRYLKRERDLLEARQSVAEGESNRMEASLAATQRALDEARSELKRELDSKATARGEKDFNKLTAEVTQLNLVRESNAHLRRENEELSKRVATGAEQLKALKDEVAPQEELGRKLKADKEALEGINTQLQQDANYWRDRLHQLVSRYHDVDPGEHRLLEGKYQEAEKSLLASQTALQTLQATLDSQAAQHSAALAEAAEQKEKEVTALKTTYDSLDKIAAGLRTKLREFKTKNDEMTKRLSEFTKSNADSLQEQKALTQRLAASEVALASANAAKTAAVGAATAAAARAAQIASAALAAPAAALAVITPSTPPAIAVVAAAPATAVAAAASLPEVTSATPPPVAAPAPPLTKAPLSATLGNVLKKRSSADLASMPASSVRFPPSTPPVPATTPVSVKATDTPEQSTPALHTTVVASGNESMMREMLLRKRQAGPPGMKGAEAAAEPIAKKTKIEDSPAPTPPVAASSSTSVIVDMTEDADLVPVQVPDSTQEQVAALAEEPVAPAVHAPVEEPASAPERAPLESSTPGLFGTKGPIRASSGLFTPLGATASDTAAPALVATPGSFSSTFGSATASSTEPVFGTKSSLPTPFTFGSVPPKVSSFGTLAQPRSFLGLATAVDSPADTHVVMDQGDRDVINQEESAGYMGGDREGDERGDGDGGRFECEDIEGSESFMEEEAAQAPLQKPAKDLPQPRIFATSSNPSSFGTLKSSTPSPFGFASTTPAEGQKLSSFGSVALSASTGSSFGAAAPFFLKPTGSVNLWGQATGSPRAPVGATASAFTASTAASSTITLPATAPVSTGTALSASASPFVPAVMMEQVEVRESQEEMTPVEESTPTPTPALTPVPSDPIPIDGPASSEIPVPEPVLAPAAAPVPVRGAAGRKPKPKPAHLTAAIPAYAHPRTRGVAVAQKQQLQSLLQVPSPTPAAAAASAAAAAATEAAVDSANAAVATAAKSDWNLAQMKQIRAARFNTPAVSKAAAGGKKGLKTPAMASGSSTGSLQESAEEGREKDDEEPQEEGQEQ